MTVATTVTGNIAPLQGVHDAGQRAALIPKYVDGYTTAFAVAAAVMGPAFVIGLVMIRVGKEEIVDEQVLDAEQDRALADRS